MGRCLVSPMPDARASRGTAIRPPCAAPRPAVGCACALAYRGGTLRRAGCHPAGPLVLMLTGSLPPSRPVALARPCASYTNFVVEVHMKSGLVWTVERRYSEFRTLNYALTKQYEELREVHFPAKKWFNNLAKSTVDLRRSSLESYLQKLVRAHRPRGRGRVRPRGFA